MKNESAGLRVSKQACGLAGRRGGGPSSPLSVPATLLTSQATQLCDQGKTCMLCRQAKAWGKSNDLMRNNQGTTFT